MVTGRELKKTVASLQELEPSFSYNSSESDLIGDFYVPCLEVADSYDRAVGYFRSSVYQLVGVALSGFALAGGHMRLVCSPGLTAEDREVIEKASSCEEAMAWSLRRELEGVLSHPDNMTVIELLSTLIAYGTLEVKVAYRPEEAGIFHDKVGIFHSAVDQLSFIGSANETFMAWDPRGNHEGFETFGSWDEGDRRRVNRHIEYFQSLWEDHVPGLRTVPLPSVPRRLLDQYTNPEGIESAIEKARDHLRRVGRTRSAPRRILQPHQSAIVQSWSKAQRGIIDHVTGGGKTVTALEILRQWLSHDRNRSAIVLVPSNLLSQQWLREIERELQDLQLRLIIVGGSYSTPNWIESLTAFTAPSTLGPRIIVSTMQSAASEKFIERVTGGDHLLIVADEVHRLGSQKHREVMRISAGGRLGLSATPERQGDLEGTHALFDYFGATLEPHFGIKEAQRAGRLVPYDYHIGTVTLEEDEDTEYTRLTARIGELNARVGNHPSEEEQRHLDMLRIQRARIVKKARQKVPHAIALLEREYVPGQRWLIYCEDTEQLGMVRDALMTNGWDVHEYHSQMVGDPPATLKSFERHGGILVAIRCLDEGIDIPMVDRALILASSSNSREYIQRRGRVLRTAPGKYSAEVHDVLVCRETGGQLEVLNNDYSRARQFANFARNEACRYRLDALKTAKEDADIEFEEEVGDTPW